MIRHFILALVAALSTLTFAQSPTSFGKSVKGLPKAYIAPTSKTTQHQTSSKTTAPWIVFSDRGDNFSTTTPGGSLVMHKLGYMEPFYISEERNGYVKLLKYKEGMVKALKLKNPRDAESYGWIPKEKLLLWQRAYMNPANNFSIKHLAIINDVGPLVNPQYYFDSIDSVYVFDAPDLKNRRGKIALGSYVYVFKRSEDGKNLLIGNSDQLLTKDAAKIALGWVSAEVIQDWGSRLYVAPSNFMDPQIDEIVNKVNNNASQLAVGYRIDPLLDTNNITLLGLPILQSNQNNHKVGYAVDVYDKMNNSLITINGTEIRFRDFLQMIKSRHKINIVYVVDGSAVMKEHFSSLTNTIQSFEQMIGEHFNRNNVKYGCVVYRSVASCGTGNRNLPLTNDYRALLDFLRNQVKATQDCKSGIYEQPFFLGMNDAVDLVANVPNQTNLFVVLGSTGNLGGATNAQISNMSKRISDVDGRLLILQSFNDNAPAFNNFIIQSRTMVMNSAYFSAEKRKNQLVEGDLFREQNFDFNLSDSISYYLDFPNNSIIQGGVVFPNRKQSLSNTHYSTALSRFLRESNLEIKTHLKSLDRNFRKTGITNANVSRSVREELGTRFNEQIGDRMPHNAYKLATSFYIDNHLFMDTSANRMEFNVILNRNEYISMMEYFTLMLGDNLMKDKSNFRSELLKNYLTVAKEKRNLPYSKGTIKKWSLNKYYQEIIGLPLVNSDYQKFKVGDLVRKTTMSKDVFESYLNDLQKAVAIVKIYAQGAGQFESNGETYYRIRGTFFGKK